jgi:sigma-E factor negative regulatory protein RseB
VSGRPVRRPRLTPARGATPGRVAALALLAGAVVAADLVLAAGASSAGTGSAAGAEGSPVVAASAADPAGAPATADDARALAALRRASAAAATTAFSGTQLVTAWSDAGAHTSVLRVLHSPHAGTSVTSRGTAGAAAGTGWQLAPVVPPATDPARPAPAAAGDPVAQLAGTSAVRLAAPGSVAGRAATVVEVLRGGSVAARYWVDDATGVLLRRELLHGSRLVHESVFVDFRAAAVPLVAPVPAVVPPALTRPLGAASLTSRGERVPAGLPGRPASARPPAAAAPSGWREVPLGRDVGALRRDGWSCPQALPGLLRLRSVQVAEMPTGTALHASYTDGLYTASVFQQQGRLDDRSLPGAERRRLGGADVLVLDGFPRTLVWQGRGSVLTLVTDAPDDVAADVVAALPREPAGSGGALDQVLRGARRAAGALGLR